MPVALLPGSNLKRRDCNAGSSTRRRLTRHPNDCLFDVVQIHLGYDNDSFPELSLAIHWHFMAGGGAVVDRIRSAWRRLLRAMPCWRIIMRKTRQPGSASGVGTANGLRFVVHFAPRVRHHIAPTAVRPARISRSTNSADSTPGSFLRCEGR